MMVDFKFIYSRHREPPGVGLGEKFSGSLYWWVELGVPSLHRECYRTLCLFRDEGKLCNLHFARKTGLF